MKVNYKFSNLLGCVYRRGNLIFSPDGEKLISPVGNRVTVYDLKSHRAGTLPTASNKNIVILALSPVGSLLIAVNEDGEAVLINVTNGASLYTYNFRGHISCVKFSPDGKKFAVTKDNCVIVYNAPGQSVELNPFVVSKRFDGMHDNTTTIDWTSDSRVLCVGSKDMNSYVIATQRFSNLSYKPIGNHKDAIIANFFERDSLNLLTISEIGELRLWESDTALHDLKPETAAVEEDETDNKLDQPKTKKQKIEQKSYKDYVMFKPTKIKLNEGQGRVTAADFNKITNILVTGFDSGIFLIHEINRPQCILIKSLEISQQSITSVTLNPTGDWIALGTSGLGQLFVYEWQHNKFVIQEQGHFNCMTCLAYSPNGRFIATGGDDCKVKLWDMLDSFCFYTFTQHTAAVTGVVFNNQSKFVVSSSLDGTVRAFDLLKYRNFFTGSAPDTRSMQFSCVAIDPSANIIAAGSQDSFEICLWALKEKRLIRILSGHEGPISELAFSSVHNTLASTSWDHTVRLWDITKESNIPREVIQLQSDGLALAYRPDGMELAVATLDGQITFWDIKTLAENHSIQGRHDLGYTRKEGEKISAKKSSEGKSFRTLCYTEDGRSILAGGLSKNICLYSIEDQILLKKFEITCNQSLDGTLEFLDRRKMTEFGSLSLVDQGQGDKGGDIKISIPGVRKANLSSRTFSPEVKVTQIRFSPTGMSFAATSTEGLMVYSLSNNGAFDPYDFAMDITPMAIRSTLCDKNYREALMMSFRLNEADIIKEVIEQIPVGEVSYISQNLADIYVDKMLKFIASQLEGSRHVEFYMLWCEKLLEAHTVSLKQRSHSVLATMIDLEKSLTNFRDFEDIFDFDVNTVEFLRLVPQKNEEKLQESQDELESNQQELSEEEMEF